MVQAPQCIHVRILSLLLNITKVDLNREKLSDKFIKVSVKLAYVLGSKYINTGLKSLPGDNKSSHSQFFFIILILIIHNHV